jgi:rubredoxin
LSCDYCRLKPGDRFECLAPELSCKDCGAWATPTTFSGEYLHYSTHLNEHVFQLDKPWVCPACGIKGKYLYAKCNDGGHYIELSLMLPVMEEVE